MHDVGVCSWSLKPDGHAQLVERLRACGPAGRAVQIALDPIREERWDEHATRGALAAAGVRVLSGMMGTRGENYATLETIRATGGVRADEHWPANLAAARGNARLARAWGIDLVTFHAGFLPHEAADPLRAVMLDRLRQMTCAFADEGVRIAFETGQEDAPTLLGVLEELAAVCPPGFAPGVNFDPANMILYGMGDPVAALSLLAPHVRQVHIKDALPTRRPGTWGTEVVVGTGAVDWARFLAVVEARLPGVALVIEREAGADRGGDILAAADVLARHLPGRIRLLEGGA
ncbi:MAG: sugar phosphate isomerase/epimerase [Phycisphaeraceae bacterium]|nr:sugar phosphate isomerase/epimerase [Phycisphaeraceae bacterium]